MKKLWLLQNDIHSVKALTAEFEALLSKKNARYTECQEKKRRVNELLTIKQNIDQVFHGASSQRRDEHDQNAVLIVSGFFKQDTTDTPTENTALCITIVRRRKKAASEQDRLRRGYFEVYNEVTIPRR